MQLRAYIGWHREYFGAKSSQYFKFGPPEVIARIPIKNYGQTPCSSAKYRVTSTSMNGQEIASSKGVTESLPPGCSGLIEHITSQPSDQTAIKLNIFIDYKTISGIDKTEICVRSGDSENGRISTTADFADFGQRMK